MSDSDNVLLVYLRRINEKVVRLIDDVRDLKVRVTNVEEDLAAVNRRIERPLDLVEQPH